jgi:hypothetical protein
LILKKVTRVALENAASVAGMILTTECAWLKKEKRRWTPNGWWYARNDVIFRMNLSKNFLKICFISQSLKKLCLVNE